MVTGILPYTMTRKGEIWEGTNLELISVKPVSFAKKDSLLTKAQAKEKHSCMQYLVGIEF